MTFRALAVMDYEQYGFFQKEIRVCGDRFGPQHCLTDSYEGGQPPCTIPPEGDTSPSGSPQLDGSYDLDGSRLLGDLEPATGIKPATCGLRNSAKPTSDHLNPQETTKQDAPEVGADGGGLSCPGSSVVAGFKRGTGSRGRKG